MLIFYAFIIVLLVLLNGFFAMSELAMVSARKSRVEQMRVEGRRGAASALRLIEDPTGFLSTVQVGITLVGIFAGAFGGSTFAGPLAQIMEDWLIVGPYAGTVAFVLVVVVITYLSLVIGELVPKRFALNRAEAIAIKVAPIMTVIAKVGAPIVWLLRVSTNAITSLFGESDREDGVTEEDVRAMIAEGTQIGVFKPKERELLEGVIRMADRTVRSIMVPRPGAVWVAADDGPDAVFEKILKANHSRYPVIDTTTDDVIGIVQTKDMLEQQRETGTIDVRTVMREPIYVHETMPILRLLERFREAQIHMAIVLDEYGSFEGVATPTDILAAIAGSLPEGDDHDPHIVEREDGSLLIDGAIPIHLLESAVPGLEFPQKRDYETMAGLVLQQLGHIPDAGEYFTWKGWRIEVVDMDGRRVDKLLMMAPKRSSQPADPAG
ncbi:hemolysin family protein [Aurantimonas sp. A2-1-M11]|uniref:hemolysin family protein n=1 Tax=Aurantimonas sp. A2-1-M11 TaxID=3113712 RepID=UPI002F94F39A